MIVRWLGSFRKFGHSLAESLEFEMVQSQRILQSAEKIEKGDCGQVGAYIGLLVPQSQVVRRFKSDVWSEYDDKGRLYKTRKEGMAYSHHTEVWVKPHYTGLVIKAGCPKWARHEAIRAVNNFNIPVYMLCRDGRLAKWTGS